MARTSQIQQAALVAGAPDDTPPPEFPSPFVFNNREPITLVELRMRRFSGIIRTKPNWWEKVHNVEKVHDVELVAKWRAEMVKQDRVSIDSLWSGEGRFNYGSGEKQWPHNPLTDAQLDYIFTQLKHEADKRDPATGIYAAAVPKVYESQSLVPTDLKTAFVSSTSVLENVPDNKKDWHPGSNEQVLDLVHPSLYCLRIGHSYVRTAGAPAGANPVHVITEEEYNLQQPDFKKYRDNDAGYAISPLYQWLPTDFAVSKTGDVKALSYINNLHPIQHRTLYPAVSSILSRFVPLFKRVLSDTLSPEPPLAITVNPYQWYSHVPDYSDNGEAADREMDGWEKWDREMKWPHVPDPEPFCPPKDKGRVELKLGGRTVQVIVKLANIVLTPEHPKYPGRSWHVEGMANEKIIATESKLDFHAIVSDSSENGVWMWYEQSDDKGYHTMYGFGGRDALNQELGHIVAEEDKCIAFPNIYQHRVDNFELTDPTKPGYRKILCFFLVDPLTRILSTMDVPPQQVEWSMAEMLQVPAMQGLPVELFDMVADYATSGTMSREEAEEYRKGLMAERANFVMQHNEEVFELEFNMCEH